VQIFVTTHSKECIDSYARVAQKLKDEEVTLINLYKNKDNDLKAIVMDSEKINNRIELNLDNR
jgi:phosphoglycerate-specific signal transduction histidine kinase